MKQINTIHVTPVIHIKEYLTVNLLQLGLQYQMSLSE